VAPGDLTQDHSHKIQTDSHSQAQPLDVSTRINCTDKEKTGKMAALITVPVRMLRLASTNV